MSSRAQKTRFIIESPRCSITIGGWDGMGWGEYQQVSLFSPRNLFLFFHSLSLFLFLFKGRVSCETEAEWWRENENSFQLMIKRQLDIFFIQIKWRNETLVFSTEGMWSHGMLRKMSAAGHSLRQPACRTATGIRRVTWTVRFECICCCQIARWITTFGPNWIFDARCLSLLPFWLFFFSFLAFRNRGTM